MKTFLKTGCALMLLFNGFGALFGGWNLIIHPDGSSLHLPLDILSHTPFRSYLIPGMILFLANGISSIVICVLLALNAKNYPWYIVAQGAVLTGWIVTQVILLRTTSYFQLILGIIGMLLLAGGFLLFRSKNRDHGNKSFIRR